SYVPYTITAPGNYFLSNDLFYNATTGVAISINSSGVNLDFAGHTLTGLNIPQVIKSTGVALATNNTYIEGVTIKNGRISGFRTGISLAGLGATSTDHVVDGMHISNCLWYGIDDHTATGCLISNNFVVSASEGIWAGGHSQLIHNRLLNCGF